MYSRSTVPPNTSMLLGDELNVQLSTIRIQNKPIILAKSSLNMRDARAYESMNILKILIVFKTRTGTNSYKSDAIQLFAIECSRVTSKPDKCLRDATTSHRFIRSYQHLTWRNTPLLSSALLPPKLSHRELGFPKVAVSLPHLRLVSPSTLNSSYPSSDWIGA